MVCGCVCPGMMTQLMEQNGLWVCMSWNDDTVDGTKWFVGVYVLE